MMRPRSYTVRTSSPTLVYALSSACRSASCVLQRYQFGVSEVVISRPVFFAVPLISPSRGYLSSDVISRPVFPRSFYALVSPSACRPSYLISLCSPRRYQPHSFYAQTVVRDVTLSFLSACRSAGSAGYRVSVVTQCDHASYSTDADVMCTRHERIARSVECEEKYSRSRCSSFSRRDTSVAFEISRWRGSASWTKRGLPQSLAKLNTNLARFMLRRRLRVSSCPIHDDKSKDMTRTRRTRTTQMAKKNMTR